jgi:hypothetical protein
MKALKINEAIGTTNPLCTNIHHAIHRGVAKPIEAHHARVLTSLVAVVDRTSTNKEVHREVPVMRPLS